MSTEQNKALVRRLVDELLNQGNTSLVEELFSLDFIEHEELPPGIPPGRDAPKEIFKLFRSAFPDFKATIEQLIAEGDTVVLYTHWTGTQKGEFLGIPPSGERISVDVIDIIRLEDGKFVEHWGVMDQMALMRQLGAIPAP